MDLHDKPLHELVGQFVDIALAQDEALMRDETARYNRLFDRMEEVKAELKSRVGDQRRTLVSLFAHPSAQVRMKAAVATLALTPDESRAVLQKIKDQQEFPQALHAGMTLWNLEQGIFKPT